MGRGFGVLFFAYIRPVPSPPHPLGTGTWYPDPLYQADTCSALHAPSFQPAAVPLGIIGTDVTHAVLSLLAPHSWIRYWDMTYAGDEAKYGAVFDEAGMLARFGLLQSQP